MSKLTDRVSYLKGMAAGMKLNMDKDANKLIMEILTVMGEITEAMQAMDEDRADLSEYVESIDDDLASLEETLFGDEDLSDEDDEEDDDVDFSDEDDDGDEDDADDELISYACPSCEHPITFRASDVDFDEDMRCPACGKPIFPELDEDE